jgi:hypothetical protein
LKEWATRPDPNPTESGPHRERMNARAFPRGVEARSIQPGLKQNKCGPGYDPNSRDRAVLETYLR